MEFYALSELGVVYFDPLHINNPLISLGISMDI
jgi:hypothetical protein